MAFFSPIQQQGGIRRTEGRNNNLSSCCETLLERKTMIEKGEMNGRSGVVDINPSHSV